MGKLEIREKQVVVPGEILASGMDCLPANGTFREGDNIVASQLGIVTVSGRLVKIVPLAGPYIPKRGDTVIGRVADLTYSSWFVDVGYAYDANLNMKEATSAFIPRGADISEIFKIGDLLVTKITNVTRAKAIDVSMRGPGLKKLVGGKIIEVPAPKVPRIVGKAGSMIGMIKDMTGCQVIAGQNGRVWISGKDPADERVAVEAVYLIAENAHTAGLTDKVKDFIEKSKEKKK